MGPQNSVLFDSPNFVRQAKSRLRIEFGKKNCHLISPTKFKPNLCDARQEFIILFDQKSRAKMLMKSTPSAETLRQYF